jgi:2-polyprenyl-6-methoxyphenol hydroxylase-like FAD-dependent oxidoreductase
VADAISIGEHAATVRFDNGSVVEAGLVIAADGADSLARRTFWPGRGLRDQGYVGWRAVVDGVPPRARTIRPDGGSFC